MDATDIELCGLPPITEVWLSDFVKRLKKAVKLQKVILFGSRAKNEHTTWSDYDLAIVSSDFSGVHPAERMARMLKLWKGQRTLEPLCFTPQEFKRQTTLLKEIRKGKVVYPLS